MLIVFLTSISRKLSGQTMLTEPLGGTQSAMINLAQSLAQTIGNQVYIFCNCQNEEGIYENVNYFKSEKIVRFSKENDIDIYICVASETALRASLKAKKTILWLHNDYSPYKKELQDIAREISGYMSVRSDKVVTVSNWQTQIIKNIFKIPANHIKKIYNGINPHLFQENTKLTDRKKHLIYISAPDRGLDLLLDFFPLIKNRLPDIQLHIYGSFKTWGKTDTQYKEIEKKIFSKTNQTDVYLHDPIPVKQLAEKMREALLFVYPNHSSEFSYFEAETFCLSAMEAQACGLPVITSKRGALVETVVDKKTGILIEGDPYSEQYKENFIHSVIKLIEDKNLWKTYSNQAYEYAKTFSYSKISKEWESFFHQLNIEQSTKLDSSPLKASYGFPIVSVIIPTYNRAKNLNHVLNSLNWQNFKEFEVIISDDGSTDNTHDVVESFRDRLNIRYIYCGDNDGFRAARTRNIGLSKARGKLIVFLDSDVIVPPNYLEEHLNAHQKYYELVVNSFVYRMKEYVEDDLGLVPKDFIEKHKENLKDDIKYEFNIFDREPIEEGYYLDSNSLSIKAEHILSEGFDANFVGWGHEDTELGYRFYQKGFKFLFIKNNCESYHIYHYVSPQKEEENKVNWQRLAKKYFLKNWYIPLPKLEVEGLVILNNFEPEKTKGFYSNIVTAKFEIKLGEKLNFLPFRSFDL